MPIITHTSNSDARRYQVRFTHKVWRSRYLPNFKHMPSGVLREGLEGLGLPDWHLAPLCYYSKYAYSCASAYTVVVGLIF